MNPLTPLKDAALTDKLVGSTEQAAQPSAKPAREPRPEDFGFKPSNEPPSYFIPEGAKAAKPVLEKVYDADKDITIGIPRGKDLDEINMAVHTQIHHKPKESFFGGVEVVGDYFKGFAKGAYYDVVSKSVALGGLMRSGDADPTPVDLVKAMDPLNVQDSLKARTKTYRYLLNRASGNALDKAADRLVNAATNHLVKSKIEPDEGFGGELAFGLGQGAMSALSSIGLAYATRNPNLVGSLFGLQQKGLKRVQLDEMGKPKDEADDLSTIYAIPEGGLEAMGLDIFINALRGSAVVRRTLLRSATEAVQEGSQQLSEGLLDKWAAKTGTSYEDIAYNVGFAALIGGLIGLPAGGMTTFLEENSVLGRIRKDENLNQAEVEAVAREIELRVGRDSTRVVKTILDREAAELELKTADAEQKASQTEKPKTPAEQKAVEVVDRIEQKGRVKRLQELRQDIEDNRDQMSESEYAELVEAVDGVLSQDGQAADEDVVRDEDGNVLFSRTAPGYGIEHRPADDESGAPLSDVTANGIYPGDIYGQRGAEFYGHYGQNHPMDLSTMSIIRSFRGRPRAMVRIYRAVPKVLTPAERLRELEKQKAKYMARGVVPEGQPKEGFYDRTTDEIDRLKKELAQSPAAGEKPTINPGDWVTINREYAVEHGESQFDGRYRILSKLVKASEIFTQGDSIHEWGYWPKGELKGQVTDPTQTPEFKAWFGDSKVVDKAGKPLVAYHVTDSNFNIFNPKKAAMGGVFWFTVDKGKIESGETGAGLRPGKKQRVVEAYLSIQNPAGREEYEKYGIGELRGLGYDGINLEEDYVVFDNKQIKSVDNRGTFDPTNPDIRFSKQGQAQPTFFSALERVIQEKMPNSASADQVRGILKNTPGIKAEEMEWLDIEGFLQGKDKVTKADLLDYIRANNVQIQEVVKGKEAHPINDVGLRPTEEGKYQVYYVESGEIFGEYSDLRDAREARERAADHLEEKMGQTKFSQYQLPGGENYRELLLTMPSKARAQDATARKEYNAFIDKLRPKYGEHFNPHDIYDRMTPEEQTEFKRVDNIGFEANEAVSATPEFRSGHFEEPNILAHVRFNERTDADGKRVLFIEEIQSDWHQAGRKRGYNDGSKETLEQQEAEKKAVSEVLKRNDYLGFDTLAEARAAIREHADWHSRWEVESEADVAILQAYYENSARRRRNAEGVPNAPFKKTWHELAMKRVLRYAAENGYDKIAWTTGEQQAERYKLSRKVEKISWGTWDEYNGKAKSIGIVTKESAGDIALVVQKDGIISQAPNIPGISIQGKHIEAVVGKGVAEKILSDDGGTLSGTELDLGVSGMKGFYDQMLPSFMNKYTKKWGGRVGTTKIETEMPFTENDTRIDDPTMDETGRFSVGPDYYENRKGPAIVDVHSLEITPAMKESVMAGQPLFSRQPGQGGLSIEQVEARVELFRKGFKRLPRIRVEQADSRVPADAEAYYDPKNREIVVLADRISDTSRLDYVILHEAIGHFGLRAVLGDKFDSTMRSIYESNEGVRKRADEVMATYKYSQAVATEEALAEMAGTATETDLGAWKGAIAAFKSVVRDQLGVELAFSDNDVLALIANARAYVQGKTSINRQARGAAAEYAQAVEDAQAARLELESIETMLKHFKGRIKPYKNNYLAEELRALPRYFMAGPGDPGITADEVVGELATLENVGFTGDSDGQAIEFLAKSYKRAQELRKEAKEPTAPRINARADKYVELLDRPTMKKYLETVEKARARVAELKAMSMEKRAELRAEMQRKIVAMRDALLDRIRLGQAKREELVAFINEAVPMAERGRFLKLVARTKDTTDMAKAMIRIQEAREKYAKKVALERVKKAFEKALGSPTVAIEYHKIIAGMAEALDESTPRPQTIKALKATRDYIDREVAAGRDPEVPRYVYESLGRLRAVPLASLSVAELQNITDRVQSLAEIGKIKLAARQRVYELTKERYLRELMVGTVAMDDAEDRAPKIGKDTRTLKEKMSHALQIAHDLWTRKMPMDVFFDVLDGLQEYQGVNSRIFKANIDAAFGEYLVLKQRVDDKIVKLNDKLGLKEENFQRIGVYAVAQQENGLEKLLNTGYKQADIDKAMQLTADEMTMYKAMRKALDEMRPLIAEVMRVTYNKDLEYVEDYFPFMTDFEAMGDAEIQDRFGNDVEQFGMKPKKNVKKGFTIKRVNDKKQAVRIDAMRVFLNHMDNASYLVTVGPQVKMLAEVAETQEYVKAAGTRGQRMVMEWLDIVARKGNAKGSNLELNRKMDVLRRLTGKAQLGFRLSTILLQPTALFDGAAIIGGDRVSQGIQHVAFSREWRQFLRDNFPELRERGADDPAFLEMGDDKWSKAAFWPIKQMDLLAASAVTAGAYELAMAKRGKPIDLANPDKEAIEEATRLMRRSQASAFFKDAPLLVTQGVMGNAAFTKLLTQFQTFVLNRWSIIEHDLVKYGIRGKKGQMVNGFIFMALAMMSEPMIRRWSKELIAILTGAELDDYEPEDYWQDVAEQWLTTVPVVSQGMSIAKWGELPVPSIGFAQDFTEAFSRIGKSKSVSKKVKWGARFLLMALPGGGQIGQVVGDILENALEESGV